MEATKSKIRCGGMLAILLLAFCLASVGLSGEEDTWKKKADMPTARYDLSASAVNGKIYVIGGGLSFNIKSGLKTVEEYDPVTNTWTSKKDMPTGRQAFSTSVVKGKIYAIGGAVSAPGSGLPTVEEYDPATDTWTKKADMPTPRLRVATSVVDGKIYAIGGAVSVPGYGTSIVEEYDPVTGTWSRKTDMPTARHSLCASVVDGKIYAIGGIRHCNNPNSLSTVEEYDPVTDTWMTKASMPTARMVFSSSVVNGRIYAMGGARSNTSTVFSTVEEYDPATDIWTIKADMPIARMGLGTSVIDGKIYAIGGSTTNVPFARISTVEEYDPNPIIVDFNGDGIVDAADICLMLDHWLTDEPLYDIAPTTFGDGIVDVQDLIVLAEHLFEELNDPTLVAHWALDEIEGDIAFDNANDNDSNVYGDPTWQPEEGMVDGALQLDGIDDYVSTPFVLNPADGRFSVFAWIKDGAPGQVVLSQIGGVNWLLAESTEGNLMTELQASGRGRTKLLSQTVITDGNWHRIGLVWDGSHRTLYIDDLALAEDTQANLESLYNGLYIGTGKAKEPGSFWSGLIDDVRIYNRAVRP